MRSRDPRFKNLDLDIRDPVVQEQIHWARVIANDGKRRLYQTDNVTLSVFGGKEVRRRRAASKVARLARAANNRRSALARRQRQKRRRQGR